MTQWNYIKVSTYFQSHGYIFIEPANQISQEWAQEQVDKKAEGWLAAKTNFKIAYFNFRQETDLDEYDFTNRQDYSIGVHSLLQYLGENEWEMVNAVNKFKDAMKSESPDVDVYYFCKTKSA